jgi:glycerophosphoryl diester phosphodiesterase
MLCLGLCLPSLGACDPEGLGRPNPDFLVIGHRGAPRIAAENTVPSFEVALALGANALEIDVCITADPTYVVWHDRDPDSAIALARQSGAEGLAYIPLVPPVGSAYRRSVEQLTFDELREHYGYGGLTGQKHELAVIPSVLDLLDFARQNAHLRALYVDVKLSTGQLDEARGLVQLIATATRDGSLDHVRFYLLSIHENVVLAMQGEAGESDQLRVVHDYEGPGALADTLSLGLRDISTGLVPAITWGDLKREIVEMVDAREDGQIDSVTLWTFDEEMQLAELLYYSVDGVMTNDPDKLYAIWQDTLH